MQLKLTFQKALLEVTGQGKNGQWHKQDLIFETEDKFQKKLCVTNWGKKVSVSELVIGKQYIIDFDIESREFNGRWYTELKLLRVSDTNSESASNKSFNPFGIGDDSDLLPF